jgi:hypothetical protein
VSCQSFRGRLGQYSKGLTSWPVIDYLPFDDSGKWLGRTPTEWPPLLIILINTNKGIV